MASNGCAKSVKKIIKEKMTVLYDFGICDKADKEMIGKLEQAIGENPGKDPRLVVDMYCRPIIKRKTESWS